jgi:HNH endonuclease
MRRLNVRLTQFQKCVDESLFAIATNPVNPPLAQGELLLLSLTSADAQRLGKQHSRIEFAVVFDHLEADSDGSKSRFYWPEADKTWPWIVYGSGTIPTMPFSLQDLPLSRDYSGMSNPLWINAEDEERIRPYIHWQVQTAPAGSASDKTILDRILDREQAMEPNPSATEVRAQELFLRSRWLAESLKKHYGYRCQICGTNFEPTYGVQVAETHHIEGMAAGGSDRVENLVVLCPNHHTLVERGRAKFDRAGLAFDYQNGVREKLTINDHLSSEASHS